MTITSPGVLNAHRIHLRLAMTPKLVALNRLDGAWWPSSDSLPEELPGLVKAMVGRFGRIRVVLLNPQDWMEPPSGWTLPNARSPWVSSSTSHERHVVSLVRNDGRRVDLLLIPMGESAAVSRAAMHSAAAADNGLTATQTLAAARSIRFTAEGRADG
jgi:hypothetical protein